MSFLVVLKHSYLRSFNNILSWSIPLLLLGVLTLPFYDLVAENEKQIRPIIRGLSPIIKSFIGGELAEEMLTPQGYVSQRYFSFIPVVLGVFAAFAGSGMLVSDEEKGYLDLLMSHPTSRTALFLGRLISIILQIITIILFGWVGLLIGVFRSESLDFTGEQLIIPYFSVFGITTFFTSFALFISLVFPSRSSAAMTTGIMVIAGFIITTLSAAIPDLKTIAMFSPITYFQANAMSGLNLIPFFGLIILSLILIVLAWVKFRLRDLRIIGEKGW